MSRAFSLCKTHLKACILKLLQGSFWGIKPLQAHDSKPLFKIQAANTSNGDGSLRVQANIGEYEASARYYVRALSLNARSSNVWGYLRTSLSCSGRLDLIPSVDDEDLGRLQQQLPL